MKTTYKRKLATKVSEALQFIEDWKSGKSCKFKAGDVVERAGGDIGVVQFALPKHGEYQVKWYIGPKPWDFIEGVGFETRMTKSEKPNPLKYKYSDLVPGPSSDQIDRLNAKLAKQHESRANMTAKEIEARLAAYEEDLAFRKEMHKADEDVDKVVPDDDDDDVQVIAEIDPVVEKREKIISEE